MMSIELSPDIERQFLGVIRDSYDGNSQDAIVTLLRLHRRYGCHRKAFQWIALDSIISQI